MNCERCQAEVPDNARFCQACGAPVAPVPAAMGTFVGSGAAHAEPIHAGIWRRIGAASIDGVLLMVVFLPFMASFMVSRFGADLAGLELTGDPATTLRELARQMQPLTFTFALVTWLYFALMETSPKQASLGKMVVGVRVTDLDGHRLSLWRSAGRSALRYLTWALFPPLLIIAAFTPRKQALHDLAARTVVVR
jgi:uncharacterized RDD family membrane protein YckC